MLTLFYCFIVRCNQENLFSSNVEANNVGWCKVKYSLHSPAIALRRDGGQLMAPYSVVPDVCVSTHEGEFPGHVPGGNVRS